jgi:hypothetical protein
MKAIKFLLLFLALPLGAEAIDFRLLWSGSWEWEKNLVNRGEFYLDFPYGLTLRAQALDKRRTASWEDFAAGVFSPGGGLYHKPTGSRLIYGYIEEWGLPARLRNPSARSLPKAHTRAASSGDLRSEIAVTKSPDLYLYLGSPPIGEFKVYGTVKAGLASLSDTWFPDLGLGAEGLFSWGALRFEAFSAGSRLPPRNQDAWFSSAPPLQERDFRLYAGAFSLKSPFLDFAADAAVSDTFAFGKGCYGNASLGFHQGAWRLSLAADSVYGRYSDRDGYAPDEFLRMGAAFENKLKRGGLFRVNIETKASSLFLDDFVKSSGEIYWRLSASPELFALRRVSLSLVSNGETDSMTLSLAAQGGPVTAALSAAYQWKAGERAFPCPDFSAIDGWDSVTLRASLSAPLGHFTVGLRGVWEGFPGKDSAWEAHTWLQAKFKPFRVRLNLGWANDAPTGSLSWQVQYP